MTNVVVTFYKDKEALNLEYLELNILNLSKNLGYCTSLLLLWQPYPAVHYGLWAHWWMYSKLLYEVKIGYQVYSFFFFFPFFYKKGKKKKPYKPDNQFLQKKDTFWQFLRTFYQDVILISLRFHLVCSQLWPSQCFCTNPWPLFLNSLYKYGLDWLIKALME